MRDRRHEPGKILEQGTLIDRQQALLVLGSDEDDHDRGGERDLAARLPAGCTRSARSTGLLTLRRILRD
jgi:hypothetical protein